MASPTNTTPTRPAGSDQGSFAWGWWIVIAIIILFFIWLFAWGWGGNRNVVNPGHANVNNPPPVSAPAQTGVANRTPNTRR
ncbi:MAG TPA: hypothetical protein VFW73_08455 [Lacipirellulaceae bacterium]|nr:hypothetical protein [Lacipirellulaceae bacterium]